jgi:hypothetical protein
VSDLLDPVPLPKELGIPAEDWQQTPWSVRLVLLTLVRPENPNQLKYLTFAPAIITLERWIVP